jgi:hypothetical protein
MIRATARVLKNIIEMEVGPVTWTCRPVVSQTSPLARKIASLFSATYETERSSEPGEVHSTVSYSPKKDEILIQVGEQKWRTVSSLFGPMTVDYSGTHYEIFEKLTGKFAILNGRTVVATGELGFRSCVVREFPTELEGFLANLALGYLIRTLVWEMFR